MFSHADPSTPDHSRRSKEVRRSNTRAKTPTVVRIEAFTNDNEPRIHDEELARRLGYARPSDIRYLIKRHEKTLKKINQLHTVRNSVERPQGGTVYIREYWLTEAQAIILIGKSETANSDEIFAEIAKAFVAFKRRFFRVDLYGAIMRDVLLPAPRTWQLEYPETFWQELHRVGGWQRPSGNNHSNCAHFINEFIYSYLLGELGLKALQDVNPSNDAGERAHRHHQFIKEKHLERLRQHIDTVERLLANSASIKHFADLFAGFFRVPRSQMGFLFPEEAA